MFAIRAILLIFFQKLIHSYPYFPECKTYDSNSTLLTTLNGKIKGACYDVTVNYASKKPEINRVLTWLAIPYAQAPVGELRFKNPKQINSWNHVIDGTKWPNICVQEYTGKTKNVSEDCLYLNLFVPYDVFASNSSSKTPIYVHIHGGSLINGASVEDRLEPSTLVAMSNIIVVTINYRLGALGFMHINGTEARGNQGILDQNLALKWVHDNAHFFGGDKNKITLAGESAGAWSVGYHLLHQKSWPYFRNAILQSGGPLETQSKRFLNSSTSTSISVQIGKEVGCNLTNSTNQDLFDCLQAADANKLCKAYKLHEKFPPIVADGIDFSSSPENLFKKGKVKKCNILIGSNTKERAFFMKSNLNEYENKSTGDLSYVRDLLRKYFFQFPIQRHEPEIRNLKEFLNKVIGLYLTPSDIKNKTGDFFDFYIKALTDARYRCPANELAETYSNLNQSAFVYLNGYHISTSDFPSKYEAVHRDELAMIFAEPLAVKRPPLLDPNPWTSTRHNYSSEERLLSEKIVTYWTNFAKFDNPNGKDKNSQDWSSFKSVSSKLRNIKFFKELPFKSLSYDKLNDKRCKFFQI